MAQKTEELEGRFLGERQRWGETIIGQVESGGGIVTVKASAEEGELTEGLTYRWCGRWTTHYKYGRQFLAASFVRVAPHDQRGIIFYLQQAPGVGPATAKALWERFGGDAVRLLREDPAHVARELNLKGFKEPKARTAAAFLQGEAELEGSTIDLMDILAGKGFPRKTLQRALRTWGARAAELIKRNPYLLMRFPGCGFLKTDAVYLERGGNAARLKRQALCLWHAISRDSEGHTWFSVDQLERAIRERIGSAEPRPVEAARLALRGGLLAVHRNGGTFPWLTEAGRALAEEKVAEKVAFLLSREPAWPSLEGLDVSPHQLQALEKALRGPVALLLGSPGTGKTYSAARLISRLVGVHGAEGVAVVAPTGKAAVRITEALQAYGLSLRARTIHSYLRVLQAADGLRDTYNATKTFGVEGWTFEHNEGNPVPERYVVVDESSMIDVEIMAALVAALPADGHILFVGDVQQLPPVGHGAPLRDLLTAGVPQGELREIRRNSGAIVETCARIRDSEAWDLPSDLDLEAGRNLMLRKADSSAEGADAILRIIRSIRDQGLADPVWEAQTLVAVNEKSPLSRRELNRLLQDELNGANRTRGARFWAGDKIVCLKNSFLPAAEIQEDIEEEGEGYWREREDGQVELYVANGELGRVLEDLPTKMVVEFFAPRRVVIVPKRPSGDGEGDGSVENFDLGYAISCHKSQGSEWPVVIVAIDDYYGAKMVCDRSWIYTAISRAKRVCILVGKEATARGFTRTQKIGWRKTFLVERLAEARALHQEVMASDRREEVMPVS